MAEVIKCLLSKHEALSLSLKERKRKKRKTTNLCEQSSLNKVEELPHL
jgi:hypothetical protein